METSNSASMIHPLQNHIQNHENATRFNQKTLRAHVVDKVAQLQPRIFFWGLQDDLVSVTSELKYQANSSSRSNGISIETSLFKVNLNVGFVVQFAFDHNADE